MKRIMCLICVALSYFANAQQPVGNLPLGITTDRTTFLLFPFQILHVDRGTENILVEQVNSAKNVLLVKAALSEFKNTNLTIITEDGAVYPFDVHYDSNPTNTVYRFPFYPINPTYSSGEKPMNLQELDTYSKMILNKKLSMGGMQDSRWNMQARVKGIFIKDDVLFFQVGMTNYSTINYSPDFIRFYIKDKKKSKRTASQEVELKPLYTYGNATVVQGNQQKNVVFAFEKFTIPEAKFLAIEIMEKNGGRHLHFKVKNGKLVRAILLPDLH